MWRVSFRSGVATLRTDVHLLLTYLQQQIVAVLTARRYASAIYAMALCPSVRPSVCHMSEFRINMGTRKQDHTIAHGL